MDNQAGDFEVEIWLCDLTYTQQTISSDVMPAAIGGIASYLRENSNFKTNVKLIKFPEKLLANLLAESLPKIIGFSNYIWNLNLSLAFARHIKKLNDNVIIIMGGPNFPTDETEQQDFLRKYRDIDIYVTGEGELAFCDLVSRLHKVNFELAKLENGVPSTCRVLIDGSFESTKSTERIKNLSVIPSPYVNGSLDEFFDGVMLPIIQTNRGCPFGCTFCVEGEKYYSKVNSNGLDKIYSEIDYIALKMSELAKVSSCRMDLHIADSNFGMYSQDIDISKHIAKKQSELGYPQYINVATGKNKKDRVLESAKILNGALRLSGSVQTLDKQILINIGRQNIKEEEVISLALEASSIGANSYSEIILGLPGDTLASHFDTIKTIVEADFNTIALYQCMLLPGTNMATRESVKKWGMKTSYRVLPRCFGSYEIGGEVHSVAEIEEICISNDSLTFQDYLSCRKMHLVINLFYNDGVFKDVLRILEKNSISKYEWMDAIWRYQDNNDFNGLVDEFINETKNELWETKEDLECFIRSRENIKKYIDGELGSNLIFKYKSIALIESTQMLADVAIATLSMVVSSRGASPHLLPLCIDLIEAAKLRMTDIFVNHERVKERSFTYDVEKIWRERVILSPEEYKLPNPKVISFILTDEQKKIVHNYIGIYGSHTPGLSRILSKVYVKKLYRIPVDVKVALEEKEILIGSARLSGLNEF